MTVLVLVLSRRCNTAFPRLVSELAHAKRDTGQAFFPQISYKRKATVPVAHDSPARVVAYPGLHGKRTPRNCPPRLHGSASNSRNVSYSRLNASVVAL